MNFAKFLRTPILQNTSGKLLLTDTMNLFNTSLVFTPEVFIPCKKAWEPSGLEVGGGSPEPMNSDVLQKGTFS